MSEKIYLSDFIFTKGKGRLLMQVTIYSVIVTGNDKDRIIEDDSYKRKALLSMKIERKNHDDYTLINVKFLKEIGTGTNN